MKSLSRVVCVVLLNSSLVACAGSALSCSDLAVQSTVLEISNKAFLEEVFKVVLADNAGAYPASVLSRISVDTWRNNPPKPSDVAANFTFEVSEILALIEKAETKVKELEVKLSDIRVVEVREGIEISSCGASLVFKSGRKVPITYTAQSTEDDKIYVEVKGL